MGWTKFIFWMIVVLLCVGTTLVFYKQDFIAAMFLTGAVILTICAVGWHLYKEMKNFN